MARVAIKRTASGPSGTRKTIAGGAKRVTTGLKADYAGVQRGRIMTAAGRGSGGGGSSKGKGGGGITNFKAPGPSDSAKARRALGKYASY